MAVFLTRQFGDREEILQKFAALIAEDNFASRFTAAFLLPVVANHLHRKRVDSKDLDAYIFNSIIRFITGDVIKVNDARRALDEDFPKIMHALVPDDEPFVEECIALMPLVVLTGMILFLEKGVRF